MYISNMSDSEALEELIKALGHIEKSREKAESEIAETELENLQLMCNDCINGLLSDIASHSECWPTRTNLTSRLMPKTNLLY